MKHCLLLITGLMLVLASPAAAQDHASGKLFSRVDGSDVKVAIEVRVDMDWYMYGLEKGSPESVAPPTAVTLGGAGITWSEVVTPNEAEKHEVLYPEGAWDWVHRGKVMFFARGRLAEGADGSDITAKIDTQTCSDVTGVCVKWRPELTTEGPGRDRHFEDYPADLVVSDTAVAPPAADDWPPDFGDEKALARLFVRREGDTAIAIVQIAVAPTWHIYHGPDLLDLGDKEPLAKPTTVVMTGEGIDWGPPLFPEPEQYPGMSGIDFSEVPVNVHHGELIIRLEGTIAEGASLDDVGVELTGQICDPAQCIEYEETIPSSGEGPDALFDGSTDAGVDGHGGEAEVVGGTDDLKSASMGKFLLLAVFWGLITLLMPCTYPMIPITISFFTKQAIALDGKVLPLSLAYGLGIVTIFILIGVFFGPLIIPFALHPVTNIVIGVAFLYFALVLFGFVTLQPPAALMNLAGKASMKGGYAGVFLMGFTLVVTSFTCTAPFVGSLLAFGAQGGGIGRIVIGMAVFGATMATPFVFLSLLPGKLQKIPSAGEWMNTLKVFLGFVEVAAALKFISNSDIQWNWLIFSREIFLALWCLIFVAAGFYLFGLFSNRAGGAPRPGTGRLLGGFLALAFAGYNGYGALGYPLDRFMTAIVPPYSTHLIAGFGPGLKDADRHEIVWDDYDGAVAAAQLQKKLLLVNFTGKI